GPEYWEALATGYPDTAPSPKPVPCSGDKKLVLDLYQKHVSGEVKPEDLFHADGSYNRLNKWNTRFGAMHLTHPANTLIAEIVLGASSTVRRQRNNVELTDVRQLICCGKYGEALRASDPTIGADVNLLARQGRLITLANPIGLYIKDLDTT